MRANFARSALLDVYIGFLLGWFWESRLVLEFFIEGSDRNISNDDNFRVEPELIYLLSPSHMLSFTDASMELLHLRHHGSPI